MWRLEPGRQGGGYRKLCLFRLWRLDCYLIDYPNNTGVRLHLDPVPGRRHYRVNLLLKQADLGGEVLYVSREWKHRPRQWWRFTIFRPDLVRHKVGLVKGRRVVLSFGAAL